MIFYLGNVEGNLSPISPYLLNMAVFGTQEASQQFHDIIFEVIIL